MLPGDHFFVHSAKDMILESVARDLAEVLSQAAQRT
jgi:surfactin synthase thioesterase subunit